MAFALTIAKLKEAMEKPGCPVCRQAHAAAQHTVDMLLWENVTDFEIRQRIIDARGFCPAHTRLFVATELGNTGRPVGVNMIYEQLGRHMADELQQLRGGPTGLMAKLKGLVQRVRPSEETGSSDPQLLRPKSECPICLTARENALNMLATLFEQFDHQVADIRQGYAASDGLCLYHLRLGAEVHGAQYPKAVDEIVADTIERMQQQSALMQEFIRKNNWEYKDEKLTPAENEAWRKMVSFFSSIPGGSFTFKKDEFER